MLLELEAEAGNAACAVTGSPDRFVGQARVSVNERTDCDLGLCATWWPIQKAKMVASASQVSPIVRGTCPRVCCRAVPLGPGEVRRYFKRVTLDQVNSPSGDVGEFSPVEPWMRR